MRHSFNANYVWELPLKAAFHGRGPNALVSGWQISGTIFARTGFPYTVIDPLISGELAQNNYFGAIYAVPAKPVPLQLSCGSDAAFSLGTGSCQPPQVLPDGSANSNANFLQAGCETGFNTGKLAGPLRPLRRRCRLLRTGTESLPWTSLLQYRLCHYEKHENSRPGKCITRNWSSVFQSFQPCQLRFSRQLRFLVNSGPDFFSGTVADRHSGKWLGRGYFSQDDSAKGTTPVLKILRGRILVESDRQCTVFLGRRTVSANYS